MSLWDNYKQAFIPIFHPPPSCPTVLMSFCLVALSFSSPSLIRDCCDVIFNTLMRQHPSLYIPIQWHCHWDHSIHHRHSSSGCDDCCPFNGRLWAERSGDQWTGYGWLAGVGPTIPQGTSAITIIIWFLSCIRRSCRVLINGGAQNIQDNPLRQREEEEKWKK